MCWYEQLDEKVREYLPDMTMEREVPLSRHTSFRIGGPARRMAFPASREQLVILMGLAESCGVKPFLLGRGTNLLVDDRGLDTLVIKTAEHMTAVRQLDEVTLETSFEDDLGADSVDLVELVMAMEEEFELGQTAEDEVKAIKTVGDAVNYVAGKLNG